MAAPLHDILAGPDGDLLADRCLDASLAPREGGELVLLWVRAAMRARSNPALEVAVEAARALDVPLLVYQALDDRHPHASDRLWTFVLEGARDLARDLESRGIRYAFHLVRPGHRSSAVVDLARRASLVVCDTHPVEPIRGWTERLRADVPTPVVEVDASCVVPVHASRRPYDRAFAFRKATSKARKRWLGWEPREGDAPRRYEGELPFEPVDLERADLGALVAGCEIDHGVGPVPHTRGGTHAGDERWEEFRDGRLARYARDRNDALRPGVSRMSPYLHFGMVSALSIAAEADRIGGPGAEKFLDELLVWRELAWHFCHHTREVDSTAAVPEWARETLAEHETDARDRLLSWAELAGAESGDALWDATQASLLRHGELHNNLRMTWGKAVVGWTRTADEALAHLLDLNHRFALDGRDPSSYGGILWCLGQFDRPFPPGERVLGTVRGRTTASHASRLDVDTYAQRAGRPASTRTLNVAIVGAGISGLTAARALRDAGHAVTLFDKGRGVGGRASRRRADPFAFDHGAQYFTARDPRFRRHVDAWVEEGVAARWDGRLAVIDAPGDARPREEGDTARFVGTPGMNAIAVRLARGLDVRSSVRVSAIEREGSTWSLRFEDGGDASGFDVALVTAPPSQAAPLLAGSPHLADLAASVEMDPCWAAMVAFEEPYDAPFDGAFVNAGPLSWVCRNGSKPGRPDGDAWVLHASPDWTRENVDLSREAVCEQLDAALAEATGRPTPSTLHADAHRWMLSAARPPRDDGAAFDEEAGLGVAGDWLAGSKVQGAWLSGRALAGRVLAMAARETSSAPWG
ncbi:MAG: FAD-dependent oxidoreductase [Planctomycetota bacterium]